MRFWHSEPVLGGSALQNCAKGREVAPKYNLGADAALKSSSRFCSAALGLIQLLDVYSGACLNSPLMKNDLRTAVYLLKHGDLRTNGKPTTGKLPSVTSLLNANNLYV